MSTFPGPIAELPGVSVDNFVTTKNGNSGCFFLSHCHTDHMDGLTSCLFMQLLDDNPEFYVYCSPMSKLMLSTKIWCSSRLKQLKELKIGMNSVIVPICPGNVVEYSMTVTCIPAGHCPGSVMFLFETAQSTVLYTGDFRIAVGDVAKFKQFHYAGHVKKIDIVYLDTTFFSESYWKFLSRDKSIQIIINLITKWFNEGPNNHVKLKMPANYGGEHILERLAEEFKCRIHVVPNIYNLYLSVPEMRGIFTNVCSESRIHVENYFKNVFCLEKVPSSNILVIKPKAANFHCSVDGKPEPFRKSFYNNIDVEVNYSSHCSYSELLDFLKYLKPSKIYPCTDTFNTTTCEQQELIDRLLSSWTTTSILPTLKPSPEKKTPEKRKPIKLVIKNISHSISDKDLDSPL